jgi:quinol-cytochrome oxidoreductase complex cytochrome b subunit
MTDTAAFILWGLVFGGFLIVVVLVVPWLDERKARRNEEHDQQSAIELEVAKFREELDALPTTNPSNER